MVKLVSLILKVLPRAVVIFIYDMVKPYSHKLFYGIRYCVLKRLCMRVGQKVIIGANVTIKHWDNIVFGSGVSVHENSYIEGFGHVEIGDNVSIAHNCSIISFTHTWADRNLPIRLNPCIKQPVHLHNNIWIGCDVRVLGNVTIYNDVIVGAGTVVAKSLAANGVYIGNPPRFHKPVYADDAITIPLQNHQLININ
ncbi:acyltransferase [Mucilaginibacter limnophilus]|uniref:Acyltransferase n=1 Tax=Mucilaginibacter limnophilus TaxID=1932778 RepID=A0A437MSV5_9SPHI|nr:acyltransferase [Mucilaginibacter limnophilus]RVU00727.1 acyltransferase [Mucilaginibacter limnophilus]